MSTIKVSVRNVVKRFGSTLAADRIDLDVLSGEFLTLLGASGCGKTTLMRMIAGFESPDMGQITIDGRDVTALPPRRRQLGMVFQQYSLFPHLTVAQNIAYGLDARKTPRAQVRTRVDEMLELVQLPQLRDRRPAQLSGGQQQRIALARALATRPSLLMLDEPLGALDLKLRQQLQVELRRIHRESGTTFLFVTHDQEEALYLSDRIAVMRSGRIEQLADPRTLYLRPANAFVADFVGEIAFLDAVHEPERRGVRLADGQRLSLALSRPAGPVRLAVRPEDVRLLPPAAGEGLSGRVQEVAHQAGSTLHTVRLASGEAVKARALGVATAGWQAGDSVRVSLAGPVMAFDA